VCVADSDSGRHSWDGLCVQLTVIQGDIVGMGLLCVQLTVIQGDIVGMDADAIVHPSDSHFGMNGEVGSSSSHFCIATALHLTIHRFS